MSAETKKMKKVKISLEDKIAESSQRVEKIKEELRIENLYLISLKRAKTIRDSSKPGALKRLILAHDPCDCILKDNVFAIYMTILRLPDNHPGKGKLSYLFPFKEKGYKGLKGDCLLLGHVTFSEEEKEVLKRYGIKWSYSTYGSIMGH
jgi:hypothetical protein